MSIDDGETGVDSLKGFVSRFRSEGVFAFVMMGAAGLGFAKTFVLAFLLPIDSFGIYITALGFASLLALLSTLGDVEVTYKLYPRLFAAGRHLEMDCHVEKLVRLLVMRSAALVLVAVAFALGVTSLGISPFEAAVVAVTSLGVVLQTVAASILRAIDPIRLLPRYTAMRGLATLSFCGIVAFVTESWSAVLAAEAAALLCVFGLIVNRLRSGVIRVLPSFDQLIVPRVDVMAGRKVYVAALIAAMIPYGGRAVILVLAGPVVAGAFGLLTVLVQAGQLLAGALSQKLGPALLQEAVTRGREARMGWLERFGVSILFLWLVASITALLCGLSFLVPGGAQFWAGFGITFPIIALTCLQMSMSAYLLLHFAAMAENRESDLIVASLASVLVFYGGFTVSALLGAGLAGYILSSVLAYVTHTAYLAISYRSILRSPP